VTSRTDQIPIPVLGFELIRNSGCESNRTLSADYSFSFERSSYITGVRCLLDGLPADLDDAEVMILRKSMLLVLASPDPPPQYSSREGRQPEAVPTPLLAPAPNLVHRLVLILLTYLELCCLWVLPHALHCLREVLRLEREHHIMKMMLEVGWACFQVCCSMCDRIAGPIASCVLRYGAEGLEGALKEFSSRNSSRDDQGRERVMLGAGRHKSNDPGLIYR